MEEEPSLSNVRRKGHRPYRARRCVQVTEFFIEGAHVIAPNTCGTTGQPGRRDVLIYNYPGGGTPIKKLTGFTVPFGVVVTE